MIKAIIFDFFGVLNTENWVPFKNKYFVQDEELSNQATLLMQQVNLGTISREEFLQKVAKLANVPVDGIRTLIEIKSPNEELLSFIKTLKPVYKIGILSNSSGDAVRELFSHEQAALFDATVFSYEIGFIKPDPRIYEAAAERLRVSPTECVYIDDKQKHCDGAVQVGMKAILYQDFKQMKAELEKVLAAGAGANN